MPITNPMKCPDCGIDMNHHADKIDYSTADAQNHHTGTGGVIQQVHTCPGCRETVMRREA
ncbi:MAG TPA: hypothetical protein VFV34_13735 [Blastocatellia bacterium]|nr:hypothetical protein [Blastocatellia bacterium]